MKNKFKKKILSILAHPKHTTNKYTEPQQYMHAIEKKKADSPKTTQKNKPKQKNPQQTTKKPTQPKSL